MKLSFSSLVADATSPSVIVGILLWSMALASGAFFYGESVQKDHDAANANSQTITQLTDIIDSSKTLAADAVTASKAMRAIVAAHPKINMFTIKDLQDALAKTIGNRVDYRFDDGLMQ